MCEDVHEEFTAGDEGARNLREEERVIFHVLEELNGDHAIEGRG